jgi:hypothetical protein
MDSTYKVIGGIQFHYVDYTVNKVDATAWAKRIRKSGYLARVIPYLVDGRYRRYAIYQSTKRTK